MRVFAGIRPCVVALILAPSVRMFIKTKLSLKYLPIPILVAAAVVFLKMSPVYIIMATIVCALTWEYYQFKNIKNDNADDGSNDVDEKEEEFISSKKEND